MIRQWISSKMQQWKPSGRHELPYGLVIDTQTGEWSEGDDPRYANRIQLVRSTPIQAAVRIVSMAMADLISNTLFICDENGERVEPTTAQKEILDLLHYSPNPYEDGHSFIANVAVDQLLDGNGLIGIDRTGQRVHSLWRMLPRDATTGVNSFGVDFYSGEIAHQRGKGAVYNMPDMIHARALNYDGLSTHQDKKGFVKGPIYTLMRSMQITGQLDEFILKYFGSDVNGIRMFIRATEPIGTDAIEGTRAYVSGIAKGNKGMAFLRNALEPIPVQTSAIDQSMSALREQQVEEASRIFGVPISLLGIIKSGTNIVAQNHELWKNSVKGHTQTLLSAMEMKLLNQRGAKRFHFAVDPGELLRGDPDSMAKLLPALGDAQRPGVLAPVEWRMANGLPATMPEDPNQERIDRDMERRQAGISGQVRAGGAPKVNPSQDDTEESDDTES